MTTPKKKSEQVIDEGLYSRQLYVLGHEAMQRMTACNVLLVGLRGVGAEIAKNIVLAGVKSVTLYDPEPVAIQDLSSQFFLKEKHIGMSRAQATCDPLAELNHYVPVSVHHGELSESVIRQFQVVVLTHVPLEEQLRINDITHTHGIRFIACDVRGVFGQLFCDFGDHFVVTDVTGEEPVQFMIADITRDASGIVTCLEEERHNLEDGDFVTFTEVRGMTLLNDSAPRPVKVINPNSFSIGDTSTFPDYVGGGLVRQVKMPKTLSFLPLRAALTAPEFVISDFAKMDRPAILHVAFEALHLYVSQHGRLPRAHSQSDAQAFLRVATALNDSRTGSQRVDTLDERLLQTFSYTAMGDLSPMAAFFGGVAGQEVLKASTGKFHPIRQWFYFDCTEVLPLEEDNNNTWPLSESDVAPQNSRYDGQIAVFGRAFQEKLARQRWFCVGAGAIGCEILKGWAMMGLGTEGQVYVCDMDTIEKSNLNRQFLFRPWDVSQPKATTAARAVTLMNPQLVGRVDARLDRVGPETEHLYDDVFFESLDGVANALDNVDARKYMDARCVYNQKCLLESGTLGTKGNIQVVLPHLTESYSSSQDPPDKQIPICTLKNFPNAIEHCIQWARDHFEGLFKQAPENANQYLANTSVFLETLAKQSVGAQRETLAAIQQYLVQRRPRAFSDCLQWARLQFQELFHDQILQLLYNFPKDATTTNGAPFWTGPKRAPDALDFDVDQPLHLQFLYTAARLYASLYGLKGGEEAEKEEENEEPAWMTSAFQREARAALASLVVAPFEPKRNLVIQVNDNEPVEARRDGSATESASDLVEALQVSLGNDAHALRMVPAEFEKDQDDNFHIDFITAVSNLRATNYHIQLADRHRTKFIAGKIIPAIATTTALITGLTGIELYKRVQGKQAVEAYKNGFVNLALPFFGFSEPLLAPKHVYNDTHVWTLWDRFELQGDLTLRELIEYFEREHGLKVTMLSSGVTLLYSFFMQKKKLEERMPMKITEIIASIQKKPIPASVKSLTFELCVDDIHGEDVEVPFVRYLLP